MMTVLQWNLLSIDKGPNSLFETLRTKGVCPERYVSVCGLRTWAELLGQLVTEQVFIHSKVMIVDDCKCILGSANINDRSLLGDRDSEIGVLIEDTKFVNMVVSEGGKRKEVTIGEFCGGLRRNLLLEHLGITTRTASFDHLESDDFFDMWTKLAKGNTEIYENVFPIQFSDAATSWNKLRQLNLSNMYKNDPAKAKEYLNKIKGHLVQFPTQFLHDSDLSDNNKDLKSTFKSIVINDIISAKIFT